MEKILRRIADESLNMKDIPGIQIPEPGEKYHHFLYLLCKELKPKLAVELGSYIATSTKYMAHYAKKVMSFDNYISADTREWLQKEPVFKNIVHFKTDSLLAHQEINEPIDVLFIDNLHTYDHTIAQYRLYEPMMADNGIMVIDDITIDKQMKKFWREVKRKKVKLNNLHHSGFGVIYAKNWKQTD